MHCSRTHLEVLGGLRHAEPIAVEYLDRHGFHHGFSVPILVVHPGCRRFQQMSTDVNKPRPISDRFVRQIHFSNPGETIFDKSSENASGVGLRDNEGSFLVAADYHHRLQLPTACTLQIARFNGCEIGRTLYCAGSDPGFFIVRSRCS